MNKKTLSFITAVLLALTACSKTTEQSASSTTSSIDNQTASETAPSKLNSKDNKISITPAFGNFTDAINNPSLLPDGYDTNQVILLQHDDANDITLYAVDLGTPKHPTEQLFSKLKTAIESNKSFSNITIGAATANRMAYQFSQTQGDNQLNESCVAIVEKNHYYSVCATGSAEQDSLTDNLKEISVN